MKINQHIYVVILELILILVFSSFPTEFKVQLKIMTLLSSVLFSHFIGHILQKLMKLASNNPTVFKFPSLLVFALTSLTMTYYLHFPHDQKLVYLISILILVSAQQYSFKQHTYTQLIYTLVLASIFSMLFWFLNFKTQYYAVKEMLRLFYVFSEKVIDFSRQNKTDVGNY